MSLSRPFGFTFLWGLVSLLMGFLVGGTVAELLVNWSAGYPMVTLHKFLIYLLPPLLLLILGGLVARPLRPSRRETIYVMVASVIIAALTALGLIIIVSIVAGIMSE